MKNVTRRDFVKLSAVAGLAAAVSPLAVRAADAGPFKRTGKPVLRLSLAAYSFRGNFATMRGKAQKVAPGREMDMFQFADYCAEHGCAGTELTSYFFAETSDEYLLKLRRHCFMRGLAISGTAIGNNFSLPKGPKLAAEVAETKRWIDRAALLGAPHIRVFAGKIPNDAPEGFTRAVADRGVIESLAECGEYAAKRGIFIGLENHDSIGTAAALLPMVKAVNNPWVGINLDSGNFRTPDPYRDFAECVPYALNVQFKCEIRPTGKPKQAADFQRFTQILRDGGYQGWVALEYEASEDPAVAIPRHLARMQELFAG